MWTYRPDEDGIMRLMWCGDLGRKGRLPTDNDEDMQDYFKEVLETR